MRDQIPGQVGAGPRERTEEEPPGVAQAPSPPVEVPPEPVAPLGETSPSAAPSEPVIPAPPEHASPAIEPLPARDEDPAIGAVAHGEAFAPAPDPARAVLDRVPVGVLVLQENKPVFINRTLLDLTHAMLDDSKLPKSCWAEAVRHACYITNHTPSRTLENTSPFEKLTGKPPSLANLLAFGQKVLVHSPDGSKLAPRARVGFFLGLDARPETSSNGARIYFPSEHRVAIERSYAPAPPPNPPMCPPTNMSQTFEGEQDVAEKTRSSDINDRDKESETRTDETRSETRPQRDRQPSSIVRQLLHEGAPNLPKGLRAVVPHRVESVEETDLEEFLMVVHAVEGEAVEPQTFAEAMRLPEKELWKNSMKEELDAHDKAGTWTIEDVPADANPVGCRWVFKIKRDANGNAIRYKSRLVAQGFSQIPGIDYFET